MSEDKLTSVWQRILDDFYSISRLEKTSREPFQQCAVRVKYGRPTRSASCDKESCTWNSDGIVNVERRSRSTVVMNWTDATLGHYGEQLWSRSVARRKAVCALSGEPIKRGDSIYKPRHIGRKAPPNATAMILASFMDKRYFSGNTSKFGIEASY